MRSSPPSTVCHHQCWLHMLAPLSSLKRLWRLVTRPPRHQQRSARPQLLIFCVPRGLRLLDGSLPIWQAGQLASLRSAPCCFTSAGHGGTLAPRGMLTTALYFSARYYTFSGNFAYWLGIVCVCFTSYYSFRLLFLAFLSNYSGYKNSLIHAHDANLIMSCVWNSSAPCPSATSALKLSLSHAAPWQVLFGLQNPRGRTSAGSWL